jgi:hypothetical protein
VKIYVWDGALADYYGGLIVAVAPNIRAARDAVRKERGSKPGDLGHSELEQDLKEKPQVVRITDKTRARAWCCNGGA